MRKDSARKIGAITENGHFALISSVGNMINHTGAVSNLDVRMLEWLECF